MAENDPKEDSHQGDDSTQVEVDTDQNRYENTSEEGKSKNTGSITNSDEGTEEELDLEKLAKGYQAKEEKPRPLFVQILITSGFILGPMFLTFDIIFDAFLGSFPHDLSYIILGITVVYVLAVLFKAWRLSREIE